MRYRKVIGGKSIGGRTRPKGILSSTFAGIHLMSNEYPHKTYDSNGFNKKVLTFVFYCSIVDA